MVKTRPRTMKKIIKEQTQPASTAPDKDTKIKNLTRAIELGCFDNLGVTVQGDKPVERENDVVVVVKSNKTQKDYFFKFGPTEEKDPQTGLQQMGEFVTVEAPRTTKLWFCRALQGELAKKPTETPQQKSEDSEEGTVSPNYSFTDFIKATKKSPLDEIPVRDCVWGIKTFFEYSQKRKYADLGELHTAAKEGVEKCVKQKNMEKIIRKNKGNIASMINQLNAMNTRVADQAKYFIQKESRILNSLIKKTLKETKQQKENKIIEQTITKTRIKTILENIEIFQKHSKVKQVKVGFKFLRETAYLNKMGILNEDLASLFRSIYGKSLDNTIQTVSEPLLGSIFTKIGLDEEMKSKVMENLSSKSSQLLANMDECQNLSKFLTDVIVEEFLKKLSVENLVKSDLINSSLQDSVADEKFKETINKKLETQICELFEKFTENAKNLVVRMSAL